MKIDFYTLKFTIQKEAFIALAIVLVSVFAFLTPNDIEECNVKITLALTYALVAGVFIGLRFVKCEGGEGLL